ncbi:MAG: aldo/keto reductase [Lachnospiraceae bacterium]|nr:aldo/keto reductase [Lachnospiraceae bacterium]
MGYLGEGTKKLGFGLMRLPKNDGVIDVEQVKVMVDRFLEAGFTYFDTAWAYGGSEEAMKEALIDRYPRESYTVATKLAAWIGCKSKEDAMAQFDDSLKRSGAGYFDYYLLHNLGEHRTQFFEDLDVWSFARELKEQGKIKHLGFSFHASAEELEEILIAHPEAEFVQLQINYADWEDNALQSRKLYEMARKYDKPIVIMEPLKGGLLANPPKPVADIFREANPDAPLPSWGIRFSASLPGVITVLSGMGSVAQMEENISYMKDFVPMTEEERAVVMKARETLVSMPMIPCTNCNYCAKVCPMNIGISGTFTASNLYYVYDDRDKAISRHRWLVDQHDKARATECIHCYACTEVCPQHIEIPDRLEECVEVLQLA